MLRLPATSRKANAADDAAVAIVAGAMSGAMAGMTHEAMSAAKRRDPP